MKINELEDISGTGTTLVTLLLPADYKLRNALQLVRNERSEAQNIKDKNTRKKVEAALKKAENELKNLGEIPENGASIYTKNDKSVTYIPEKQLNEKLYRCDNKFHTEPVKKLNRDTTRYGIIQADRDYYRVGMADKHGNTNTLREGVSGIPSKHSKGGQSAQRWERYRSEKKKNYVKEISDTSQKHFLKKLRNNDLLGIIISGTLNRELKNQLNNELENKIVAEASETQNLEKAFKKVKDNLKDREQIQAEKFSEQFLDELSKDYPKAEYGETQVKKATETGAVKTLMIPEGQYV